MKLARAMMTVAGLTGISRLAGFTRDILTASILGAGPIADAFFVALKLPNFFRRVTAEGAFSVAFVPLYSELSAREGRAAADLFASRAFAMMLCILSVVVCLALLGMPYIIAAIAPGFIDDPVRFEAAVDLSRVTFPYLLLISLSALLGGVLNALDRFAPFAFAPVLFNLCLITALLLSGFAQSAGHALAWGILAAGVVQLVWLYACARRAGVALHFVRPKLDVNIRRVLALMGPGVIGAGVMHINLFADMMIASFLETGSVSYLYYADRLNQLPLGVVGIAVGTALLPMLSKAVAAGEAEKAADLFNRAMGYCFLLALPAAVGLGLFSELIISVLFERGAFGAADASVTSFVLMAYVVGLPAYIAIKIFSTVHWAHKDTKTPVRIAVVATLVNIALSLVLIQFIGVAGIALATGLTGWLQIALHFRALKSRDGFGFDGLFREHFIRIVGASALMAAACLLVFGVVEDRLPEWGVLLCVMLSGALVYGLSVVRQGVVKPFKNRSAKRKDLDV